MSRHTFECQSKDIKTIFEGHYTIGSYQREYRWGGDQIRELVDDFRSAFVSSKKKSNLGTYFMGPIVTQKQAGITKIVDGQQRLTTLMLMFIYLNRRTKKEVSKTILKGLLYSYKSGKEKLSIDVPERSWVVEAIIAEEPPELIWETLELEDSLSNENIYEAFRIIEDAFNEWGPSNNEIDKFVTWIAYEVRLIEIYADNNDAAGLIFETMNDRGMSLNYSDLLKSHIISLLTTEKHAKKVDTAWKLASGKLFSQNRDGEKFFRAWLRAKYAIDNEDYDVIAGKFHHWVRDNHPWGAKTDTSVTSFIEKDMVKLATHYLSLQKASKPINFDTKEYADYNAVYYNAKTQFDLQFTCSLAPLLPTDNQKTVDTKIRLVSNALDIFVAHRMVNNISFAASTVKGDIFKLILSIRNCKVEKLQTILLTWLKKEIEKTGSIRNIKNFSTRKTAEARYLLARISAWVDQEKGHEITSTKYYMSTIFDVEHILPDTYRQGSGEFGGYDDWHEYRQYRDRVSAQILLEKDINRSVKDMHFANKVSAYLGSENCLAFSLAKTSFSNSPNLRRLQDKLGEELGPFSRFEKEEIDKRGKLYAKIATKIWDPKQSLKI